MNRDSLLTTLSGVRGASGKKRMNRWMGLPFLGIVVLSACAPREKTPDEMVLLDESGPLTRDATTDIASRDLEVDSDSVIVAIVDESLTDVKVTLASVGAHEDADSLVEVENNLAGAGVELAALEVPADSRVKLTLVSQQDAKQPGKV